MAIIYLVQYLHSKVLIVLLLDIILNCLIGLTPFVDNFTHLGTRYVLLFTLHSYILTANNTPLISSQYWYVLNIQAV